MRFQKELYPYQTDILNVFQKELERGDKKIHIVAPPGSGKTIVGLEMVSRLDMNTLILVPNLTLQEQWKDKIRLSFLEPGEDIEALVSFDPKVIRKINIITYQSLTQTGDENDAVMQKILDGWYKDFREEFPERKDFDEYVVSLRESDVRAYGQQVAKYKKGVKLSGDGDMIDQLLSAKVKNFFAALKANDVKVIVVDEAHHLTSWWSMVIYRLWQSLGENFIIGLTATPPFDNVDFFDLNDEYANLLGEVDYYIPTPAIIKSGRLAPYSDLVYFVAPDHTLDEILKQKEEALHTFLKEKGKEVAMAVYEALKKEYATLEKNSVDLLDSYLRFVYRYAGEQDISHYINVNTTDPLVLEDIAKSIGKWLMIRMSGKKGEKMPKQEEEAIKKMFFDLGYIWRGRNFYRFQTPVEKLLIYSKTKLKGVTEILDTEIGNLGKDLRCAIITDFLDADSDFINCTFLFDSLIGAYAHLNPYLVSGQGIWRIGDDGKRGFAQNETILSVTNKLMSGDTKLVIGTKGILGEGWDCPKLNTLIDLTGMTAYMSVNQVRGRAIRLDPENPDKTANIYDIVCLTGGLQGRRDYRRLESKHEKFYGVNDAGIVVKGVDHVYPNLSTHLEEVEKINRAMLNKSKYRDVIHGYWRIGGNYENKEIFGMNLEISRSFSHFPLVKIPFLSIFRLPSLFSKEVKLKELEHSYYFDLIYRYVFDFVSAITSALKYNGIIPDDFEFELSKDLYGNIKVLSKYHDEILSKGYISFLASVFSPITDQKYVLGAPILQMNNGVLEMGEMRFGLPEALSKNKEYRDHLTSALIPNGGSSLRHLESIMLSLKKFLQGSFVSVIIYASIAWIFVGVLFSRTTSSIDLIWAVIFPFLFAFGFLLLLNVIYAFLYLLKSCRDTLSSLGSKLSVFHFISYYRQANAPLEKRRLVYYALNSAETEKKDFIGKAPFITGRIEKLWI